MLDSIELIEDYTSGKDIGDFISNKQLQDSVIRRIEIIGEAAKNIPESITGEHPEIPWKDIAGMRDVVVHGYFGVDPKMVWKVVERDIPELKTQIEEIIKKM